MSDQPTVPVRGPSAHGTGVHLLDLPVHMHAEREQLVKYTFPELRRKCRERHVRVGRGRLPAGGSTRAGDARRGGVRLPRGDRPLQPLRGAARRALRRGAAWRSRELIKERWLDDPEGRSLTEVEILYSTLERSEQPKAAYFYFRDPAYLKHISREQRADFVSDFAEAQTQLAELKRRIRESHLPVRELPRPRGAGAMGRSMTCGGPSIKPTRSGRCRNPWTARPPSTKLSPRAGEDLHRPCGIRGAPGRARRGREPTAGDPGRIRDGQVGPARQLGGSVPPTPSG